MPVTTSTQVTTKQTGFRAFVDVRNDGTGGGGTSITVDVKLEWDATKADHVQVDPDSDTPTEYSKALGLAIWKNQALEPDQSEEFGVILRCAFGVSTSVTVTGGAANVQEKSDRDESSASWSCGLNGPS